MSSRKHRQIDRMTAEAEMTRGLKIPDESAWYGYEEDLDVRYLHGLFYGKSIEEVQSYFGEGRSIERMGELLFAPRAAFQYYVRAFAHFVMSEAAAGDSDSASPFLSLLEEREKKDPGSVRIIFPALKEALAFVAKNQAYFEASIDIYGNFNERVDKLYATCNV
ncbi:MAG: hypothetical protein NTY70_06075 [Burkholderiales bacterium]|nr:hypothetical protein [Burkholderiales bacterium]